MKPLLLFLLLTTFGFAKAQDKSVGSKYKRFSIPNLLEKQQELAKD